MDLKKFLEDNPIINQAELSRLMWPTNSASAAKVKLANKLANRQGQRITEKDIDNAIKVLNDHADLIKKLRV